ncbi:MAG: hypothetical protein V8R40_10870 [Dysosmobacter sp.]
MLAMDYAGPLYRGDALRGGLLRASDADPGDRRNQLETNQTGTIQLTRDGEYQARFIEEAAEG